MYILFAPFARIAGIDVAERRIPAVCKGHVTRHKEDRFRRDEDENFMQKLAGKLVKMDPQTGVDFIAFLKVPNFSEASLSRCDS